MTEEEAKTKWCPFVRQGDGGGGGFNRGAWGPLNSEHYDPLNIKHNDGTYACTCIGSACMAWRYSETEEEFQERANEWENAKSLLASPDVRFGAAPTPFGYCGLAGKP